MKVSYIPYYIKQLSLFFPLCIGYLLSFLIKHVDSVQGLWLLMERGFDAQDNAWHLLNYLRRERTDINVRYAIKRSSRDFDNIKPHREVLLNHGSILYYIYLYSASYIVSTHIGTYYPSLWLKGKLEHTIFQPKGKVVFLQHGITHNNIAALHYSQNHNLDLFICGAKNEYDLVSKMFNYPEGIVRYTGFARFDNLGDFKSKHIVLIMPTWRIKYKYYNDAEFLNTDYYKRYKEILTNPKLKKCLEESGYHVVFMNHVEFQKFNHLFEDFNDSNIKIMSLNQVKVQDMLKDSDVLVTDYSSIYYDFIYMAKPVIFYHINKSQFYNEQYGLDCDDVSKFGYVSTSSKEVIDTICDLIARKCNMLDEYLSNMKAIFPYRDQNNCKRIVDAILSI